MSSILSSLLTYCFSSDACSMCFLLFFFLFRKAVFLKDSRFDSHSESVGARRPTVKSSQAHREKKTFPRSLRSFQELRFPFLKISPHEASISYRFDENHFWGSTRRVRTTIVHIWCFTFCIFSVAQIGTMFAE